MKLKNDEVTIKIIGCKDGRKHQNLISKDDTVLPTVSTEGLMLACMIDTMEVRDIETADITAAFLQTDYDKVYINIRMEG